MTWTEQLNDLVHHPASKLAAFASMVGIAVKPAVAHAALLAAWQSAGSLFTASSIASSVFGARIPQLQPVFTVAAIGAGALFLAKLATKTYENFENKL